MNMPAIRQVTEQIQRYRMPALQDLIVDNYVGRTWAEQALKDPIAKLEVLRAQAVQKLRPALISLWVSMMKHIQITLPKLLYRMQPWLDMVESHVFELIMAITNFSITHPLYTTIVVLVFLLIFARWLLRALGFAAIGIVRGVSSLAYVDWR